MSNHVLPPLKFLLKGSLRAIIKLCSFDPNTKYILAWCDLFGSFKYRWEFGGEKFLQADCPESRCYLTSDRNLLGSVADFDAILFHQVSCDWWTPGDGEL